jgi:hypothetical protein
MSNEIAVQARPMTSVEIKAQVQAIQQVMEAVMKPDVHYGKIPGTQKNTLYKAGSEKILSTFRIAVDPVVEDLSTADCYRYRVVARGVLPTGEIVGAGVGEASTDEEKYRWRGAVCQAEFNATPEDRKRVKWDRYGKETQQVRTNPADLANTVLKMAKKRAQIDLTLTATGASDVFEQDLEDMPEELRGEITSQRTTTSKPQSAQPREKAPGNDGKIVSEAQSKMLYAKLKNKGITPESFCAHYKIEKVQDLPFSEMNPALKLIDAGEIAEVAASSQPAPLPGRCVECGGEIKSDFCTNPECIGYRDPDGL